MVRLFILLSLAVLEVKVQFAKSKSFKRKRD